MTKIKKTYPSRRTQVNNNNKNSRINQIIRDGINRAADQDKQFMLRALNVIEEYRSTSAAFSSWAV